MLYFLKLHIIRSGYITSDGLKIINKKIENKDTIKTIESYLQQFYIEESEEIELKRTKIEGPITGEYSTISHY